MEEDYSYYEQNHKFDPNELHYCDRCGGGGALLYNQSGQRLNIGGFNTDVLLCPTCHEEKFSNHYTNKQEVVWR